jgi:surfeit locus 1 family protein
MRFRPRFWPTLFTIPTLLVLIGLGTWQVERLHWKEGLIALRAAAAAAPPVELPATPDEAKRLDLHRVHAAGTFLHEDEFDVVATAESGTSGFHIVTPLRLDDGTGRIVLVNRGFVPYEKRDPATRLQGDVPGRVEVEGLLRRPLEGGRPWYMPADPPGGKIWLRVEPDAMARARDLQGVQPFYIDAGPAPNPGGWPRGGTTVLDLPNNHLQYAITWYALAGALLVIYILYHRRSSSSTPAEKETAPT